MEGLVFIVCLYEEVYEEVLNPGREYRRVMGLCIWKNAIWKLLNFKYHTSSRLVKLHPLTTESVRRNVLTYLQIPKEYNRG